MHAPLALALLDEAAQVAALAELHDDVDRRRRLVDNAVIVADDEGVAELTEDVDLAGAASRGMNVTPLPSAMRCTYL